MLTFVYRSHKAGVLSKRVVKLPASSVLEWFARHIAEAASAGDVDRIGDAVRDELGGFVYGLSSLFDAAKEHALAPPGSTDELRALLREHLYVEGGPENIRVDDHSVRVLTDDDEVRLAYFFFDDAAIAAHPHRLAYLLLDEPRLPASASDTGLDLSRGLDSFEPRGTGAGATYACLFTFYDGDSLPGTSGVFEGVRLPELAAHLRAVVPYSKPEEWSAKYLATWPLELRALRAMVEPGDTTLSRALERVQELPLHHIGSDTNHTRAGVGPHAKAKIELVTLAQDKQPDTDPSRSIIDEHPHALLFAMHATKWFGHQQWILFDDLWAAAHEDLARSILQYATGWDPLEGAATGGT